MQKSLPDKKIFSHSFQAQNPLPSPLHNRDDAGHLLAGDRPDSIWLFTCGLLYRMEIMGQKPRLERHAAWACVSSGVKHLPA